MTAHDHPKNTSANQDGERYQDADANKVCERMQTMRKLLKKVTATESEKRKLIDKVNAESISVNVAGETIADETKTALDWCKSWLSANIERTEQYLDSTFGTNQSREYLSIQRYGESGSFVSKKKRPRIEHGLVKKSWKHVPRVEGEIQSIFERAEQDVRRAQQGQQDNKLGVMADHLTRLGEMSFKMEEMMLTVKGHSANIQRIHEGIEEQLNFIDRFLKDGTNEEFLLSLPIYEPDHKHALTILHDWAAEGLEKDKIAAAETEGAPSIAPIVLQFSAYHWQSPPQAAQFVSNHKLEIISQCIEDLENSGDSKIGTRLANEVGKLRGLIDELVELSPKRGAER